VLAQPVTTVADALVPVVVDAVDLNEAVNRVDVNELVQRIDVDVLMSKIDIETLVARVDVQAVARRIDVNDMVEQVDVQAVVDRMDIDELLEGVDVNALLRRVDLDALLASVDVNDLLERLDIDTLLDRVDLNKLLARVDMNAIAGRIEVGSLVGRGTEGLLQSFLDLVRRQVVALDVLVMRLFGHLRSRKGVRAEGPAQLLPAQAGAGEVSGRYAGPVSRLLAFAVDVGVVFGTFALASAVLGFLAQLVSGAHLTRTDGLGWSIALGVWSFLYFWLGYVVAGRTVGKALVGLRVVSTTGAPIGPQRALVRVLVFPFSFVLFGVGLVMALFHRERRTLHDVVAGTTVVYDWGDRPAEMPAPLTWWLSRKGVLAEPGPTSGPSAAPRLHGGAGDRAR
jgi:uncharacterized RDD family membrane protein YckC